MNIGKLKTLREEQVLSFTPTLFLTVRNILPPATKEGGDNSRQGI